MNPAFNNEFSLIFTVTNDLSYDQRMQRICRTLASAGYRVTLVGRQKSDSIPLKAEPFQQVRLPVRRQKGKGFYLEYSWQLYNWLRRNAKPNTQTVVCAIDTDTLLPVWQGAGRRKIPIVHDAHELFTELTEVKRRPIILQVWKTIQGMMVPKFKHGYTVNSFISNELKRMYHVEYEVIRNLPALSYKDAIEAEQLSLPELPEKFYLYQGAVNEGRAFETLIPAMARAPIPLVIAGDGNYLTQARSLASQYAPHQVFFTGMLTPAQLKELTPKAFAGLTLFDNTGLNQYQSLANRFFDYIQAGIPQICVLYPEYATILQKHPIALGVTDVSTDTIAAALNKLWKDDVLYASMKAKTAAASAELSWSHESQKLLGFWHSFLTQTFPTGLNS